MLSEDKKHCESYGHGERVATHKRNSPFNSTAEVYMCYECHIAMKDMQSAPISKEVDRIEIQELKVPGHDDK